MPIEPYPDQHYLEPTKKDNGYADGTGELRWAMMVAFPMMKEKDIKYFVHLMRLVNESRGGA